MKSCTKNTTEVNPPREEKLNRKITYQLPVQDNSACKRVFSWYLLSVLEH